MSSKFSQLRNARHKPPHCRPGFSTITVTVPYCPKKLHVGWLWKPPHTQIYASALASHFYTIHNTPCEFYQGWEIFPCHRLIITVTVTIIFIIHPNRFNAHLHISDNTPKTWVSHWWNHISPRAEHPFDSGYIDWKAPWYDPTDHVSIRAWDVGARKYPEPGGKFI